MALAILLSACGGEKGSAPPAARGPVTDFPSLVDSLRAAGIDVEDAGETRPPFLPVPGRVARADGDLVQLYAFADSAAAEDAARGISPDGFTIAGRRVAWLGPPHFHRRGRLLFLHIGDEARVSRALAAMFGPPFAGPEVAGPGR